MLCGIKDLSLLRLAFLANGLVLGYAILVEESRTDPALGHVVRRWTCGFLEEVEKFH